MQVLLTLKRIGLFYIQEKLFESSPEQIGASSKEVAIVTSDVPMKFSPKLEAEVNNDGQGSTGGTPKCFGQAEQDEKSSMFDTREPPSQSMSGDESDESDIVEHDVSSGALLFYEDIAIAFLFQLNFLFCLCSLYFCSCC